MCVCGSLCKFVCMCDFMVVILRQNRDFINLGIISAIGIWNTVTDQNQSIMNFWSGLNIKNIAKSTIDSVQKCHMSRMLAYDSVNRNVLSRVRKVARDGADVMSGGRQFHTRGPATENARRPTVERWAGCWTKQSLQEERSPRDLEGAQQWSTSYTKKATFNKMRSRTSSHCAVLYKFLLSTLSDNFPDSTEDVFVHWVISWRSAHLTFSCLHNVYSGSSSVLNT